VEAVGDYLDSRCSDFSDEGEDALCAYQGSPTAQGAYQGERNAEAETETANLTWRHLTLTPTLALSTQSDRFMMYNSNPNPKPSPNPNPNPNPNSNPIITLTLSLSLTRRASSPADAHGGGAGVWGLWPPPTTSEAAHVEPGVVRPRREKAVAAVRATTALERGRSPGVAAGSGSAPKGSASCHASCPPAEEARSRHKLAMQPEERAHEPSTLSVLAEAAGAMQERKLLAVALEPRWQRGDRAARPSYSAS
jgi:hypothetical protein